MTREDDGDGIEGSIIASMSAPVKKTRIAVIDSLRGCLLILMALDHLGGFWSHTMYERFGFFSAAEGFFFLSGLVATQVALGKDTPGAWFRKRALTIWSWHMLSVFAVGLLVVLLANYGWHQLPGFAVVQADPIKALPAMAVLLHLPDFLDVLPLYVLLMLVASGLIPLLIQRIHSKRKVAWSLWGISTVIWGIAQFQVWGMLRTLLPSWMQVGAFDPLAWQWIFFSGAALALLAPTMNKWKWHWGAILGMGAILGLLWKNNLLGVSVPDRDHFWASRHELGPLRILSFACFAGVVSILAKRWPNGLTFRFTTLLGRHSLYVFVWHLPLVYLWLFRPRHFGEIAGIILPVLLVLSMAIPALWREKK